MTRSGADAEASLTTLCDLIALARKLSLDLPNPPSADHQELAHALSVAYVAILWMSLENDYAQTQGDAP